MIASRLFHTPFGYYSLKIGSGVKHEHQKEGNGGERSGRSGIVKDMEIMKLMWHLCSVNMRSAPIRVILMLRERA